jgi:hypothetical protein
MRFFFDPNKRELAHKASADALSVLQYVIFLVQCLRLFAKALASLETEKKKLYFCGFGF